MWRRGEQRTGIIVADWRQSVTDAGAVAVAVGRGVRSPAFVDRRQRAIHDVIVDGRGSTYPCWVFTVPHRYRRQSHFVVQKATPEEWVVQYSGQPDWVIPDVYLYRSSL